MSKREQYQERGREFYRRYYGQLVGAKITKYMGMKEEDEFTNGFPTFVVELADGSTAILEVSMDEEGNGGGFLFGLKNPTMDDYDKKHGLNSYEKVGA